MLSHSKEESKKEVSDYLTLLDPTADSFLFVALGSNGPPGPPLYNTLDDAHDQLWAMNELGFDIYVTVNEVKGKRRRKVDITRIRAVWCEDDGDGLDLPAPPHFSVATSPGRKHDYVLVDGLSKDDHAAVMARMVADYGSDPNAKDVSRILRLPGFYNTKRAEPFWACLIRESEHPDQTPLTRDEILTLYQPVVTGVRGCTPVDKGENSGLEKVLSFPLVEDGEVLSALSAIPGFDDYGTWVDVGLQVHAFDPGARGLALWDLWSQQETRGVYSAEVCAEKWTTFASDDRTARTYSLESLMRTAASHGWVPAASLSSASAESGPDLAHLLDHWVYIRGPGTVLDLSEGAHTYKSMASAREGNRSWARYFTEGDRPKVRSLVDDWLDCAEHRWASQVVWDRSREYGEIFCDGGGHLVNALALGPLWLSALRTPELMGEPTWWLSAFNRIVEDPMERSLVLDWISRLVRYPGERLPWGLYMVTRTDTQGTGRTSLWEAVGAILGGPHFAQPSSHELQGRFKRYLTAHLKVCDEIRPVGQSRRIEMNALFSELGNNTISMEVKGKDSVPVRITGGSVLLGNNAGDLDPGDSDRRLAVIECSSCVPTQAQTDEFLSGLRSESGLRDLAKWFVQRDAPALPSRAPLTEMKKRVLYEARSADWHQINDAVGELGGELWTTSAIGMAVYGMEWIQRHQHLGRSLFNQLRAAGYKVVPYSTGQQRHKHKGRYHRIMCAEHNLAKFKGMPVELRLKLCRGIDDDTGFTVVGD